MKDCKTLRIQVIGWMLRSMDLLPHVQIFNMLTYVSNLCIIFMLTGNTRGHARTGRRSDLYLQSWSRVKMSMMLRS